MELSRVRQSSQLRTTVVFAVARPVGMAISRVRRRYQLRTAVVRAVVSPEEKDLC